MILEPQLAELVRKGKKVVERRRIVDGRPCSYKVGQDYPVQPGHRKAAICRVTVLDRQRQLLGALTYEDAIAEGFRARADFARRWMRLHDRPVPIDELTADEVVALWLERHGDTRVWVVSFELKRKPREIVVSDRPVYLHRYAHRGLTTDPEAAAVGEPEVIGETPRHASIARARREAEASRVERIRHVHRLLERARNGLDDAIAFGTEIDPDVTALEELVQGLEEKLRAA